jgi:hypothetical protein
MPMKVICNIPVEDKLKVPYAWILFLFIAVLELVIGKWNGDMII